MGEFAEAAIWAEINGRDPSDMSPEDWIEFYDEYDEPADDFEKIACPQCGKKVKGENALSQHTKAKHRAPA